MANREDTPVPLTAGVDGQHALQPQHADGIERLPRSNRLKKVLRWGGTIVLIAAIFSVIPISDVAAALRRVHVGFFIAGLVLQVLNMYSEAIQLWVLLRRVSVPIKPWNIFETNLITRFYGQFLPSDLLAAGIKFYRLSAPTRQYGEVVASLIFFRVANMSVLALSGLVFWAIEMPEGPGRWVGLVLIGMVTGLFAIHVLLGSPAMQQRVGKVFNGKAFAWLRAGVLQKLQRLFGTTTSAYGLFGPVVALILLMAVLRHAVGILSFSMLARSLDLDISLLTIGWIRAVLQAALMLPVSVSGIGVREGSLVLLLQEYDVAASDAVALAFLMLATSLIANALGGFLEVKNLLFPARDERLEGATGAQRKGDNKDFGRPATPLRGRLYLTLQELRGRPVGRFMRELQGSEALGREDFQSQHRQRLQRTVQYAKARVPLYRAQEWAAARCSGKEFLSTWPLLSKDMVDGHAEELLAQPRPERVATYRTSGSTGTPVRILWTNQGEAWWWAQRYRSLEWHGIPVGARTLRLTHRRRIARDFVLGQHAEASLHSPVALERAVRFLERERPPLVFGPPSMLFYFARCLRELGVETPVASVARSGGEPVYPFQRREIERYVAGRLVDSYGSSEVGAIASECPHGSMHVLADFVHLEIVKQGAPVLDGNFGEVVVTPLHNEAMPLIRYRSGDGARLLPEQCTCGLPHPVITDLRARISDMFEGVDGTMHHASAVCVAMGELFSDERSRGVRQFQLIQSRPGHWLATLETAGGGALPVGADRLVEQALQGVIGSSCKVETRVTGRIESEKGKLKYCRRAN